LDFHTDMYSLGATLYHMVTGHIPFDGEDHEAVMKAQVSRQLSNPRDMNPNVTPGCVQIITKLMMKEPNHRFRSWSTAARELGKLASGKLVVTKVAPSAVSTIAKPGELALPNGQEPRKPAVASKQRLAQLQKKYKPKRAPLWVRVPCELLMLGWFLWLAYQLLWLPTRPEAPSPPVIPNTLPPPPATPTFIEKSPETPEVTPSEPAEASVSTPPRPAKPIVEAIAPAAPAPEPEPEPVTTEAPLPELKRKLVRALLSGGVSAAQKVLTETDATPDAVAPLSALMASKTLTPEGVADAFTKQIGQRSQLVHAGRKHHMEVTSVDGLTVSVDLFASGSSNMRRPTTFTISQLDPAEQSRWLGDASTREVAIAKFALSMTAGDFINARSLAESCGPLAEACIAEADARIRMLVE
ncbi:MAG: hypothetical protein HN341_03145, partial [Verrucomicrobia bacterium]|nr:hypothetical protein [Verrucomicrobiota bacterium]